MTKKYDVYGIGNALVDFEFEVEPPQLNELKVEKGVMTLVDEPRQNELFSQLTRGAHKRACGGSAANTMIAVAQFGGKSFYSCKVANDETGQFYYQDLLNEGVATNLTETNRRDGVTGKCLVMVTPDADRTMNTYLGITETLSVDEVCEKAIQDSEWVYMEGYLVTSDTGRAAAIRAREIAQSHGVQTSLTFSDPNMVKFFKEGLGEMMGGRVNLLFCNESEAKLFTDKGDVPSAAESLKNIADRFVITLGPEGALVYDGSRFIDIPVFQTQAIDTNGAGDLFAGAFLHSITSGKSFEEAGKFASLAASKVVSKYGPRLEKSMAQDLLRINL